MQPYFFPYLGYFQAINAVDKYILYDNINFINKSWIYRNKHLLINNDSCFFTLSLKEKSVFKKIHEIELNDKDDWRRKLLKSIYFNYKKAKYFDNVYPLVETVVNFPTNKLSELNFQSIKCVCDYLNIKTELSNEREKYSDIERKLSANDLYEIDFPDLKLIDWQRKVIRVMEICRIECADVYINAIGGQDLYSKDEFLMNGIELKFIKSNNVNYKQFNNDFIPNLSIIDFLMFVSPDLFDKSLNEYELI